MCWLAHHVTEEGCKLVFEVASLSILHSIDANGIQFRGHRFIKSFKNSLIERTSVWGPPVFEGQNLRRLKKIARLIICTNPWSSNAVQKSVELCSVHIVLAHKNVIPDLCLSESSLDTVDELVAVALSRDRCGVGSDIQCINFQIDLACDPVSGIWRSCQKDIKVRLSVITLLSLFYESYVTL